MKEAFDTSDKLAIRSWTAMPSEEYARILANFEEKKALELEKELLPQAKQALNLLQGVNSKHSKKLRNVSAIELKIQQITNNQNLSEYKKESIIRGLKAKLLPLTHIPELQTVIEQLQTQISEFEAIRSLSDLGSEDSNDNYYDE